jgi:nitrous oxide reductase accessory protein NosL
MIRKAILFVSMTLMLTGCWGEAETGPVDVKYNRETCEYCRMIISDPRFTTEIRKEKSGKVFKFDDMGDAVHWLNIAKWKVTAETEIWVRDMTTGKKWLDARKVFYLSGQHSPMEYGYGAVAEKTKDTVSFEEMQKAVIARGSTTRCDTPDYPNSLHTHDDDADADAAGKE